MVDIELVIKMPEEVHKSIINGKNYISYQEYVEESIKNGIPLPKGHGRLIDADELKKHKYRDNDRYENAVAVAQIDWADTIIEADKAESEDAG